MATLPIRILKSEFSECIICGKPLGQDSKDARHRTCHDHRACIKCNLPLHPREIQLAHDRVIEDSADISTIQLIHTRCEVVDKPAAQDSVLSIKQSEYDFLNMLRLMCTPNRELSGVTNENNAMIQSSRLIADMDFDSRLLHLKMMEACVAQVSIALRTDKSYRKEAFKEREEREKKLAEKQKLVSSSPKPPKVAAVDPEEIALGTFMELHGLTERKTAQSAMRDMWKAVKGLTACGIPEPMARENVVKQMVLQGRLKK